MILSLAIVTALSFFGQAPKNCEPDVSINTTYSKANALQVL